MRRLLKEEIGPFASRVNVDQEAVWNFLGTAHHCGTYVNALCNLIMDSELYRWNDETINAIMEGLKLTEK